ncbi:hypothetical protein N1851_028676 [Merluccius polli]|uniref:Uncharacterized protein n=1 Tax=Merluccius polli TaxID=89951 RepID=A0AA47M8A6_MERPO|nr:hypothetical protein N1851_028676 [Merluccius polli]
MELCPARGIMVPLLRTDGPVEDQILHQPTPEGPSPAPTIHIDGNTLENVDHFQYLGSLLSTREDIDAAIYRHRVFENRDIQTKTKLLVYQAVVLPSLLYGAESWTTYSRHIKALEQYHQRCLRKILRTNWEDRRTNISILVEANLQSISTTIT